MNAAPIARTSVADALAAASARGVARLDAQLMLAHVLCESRTWLIAHDDSHLTPAEVKRWLGCLDRRVAGEPLAYLVGHKEFHGLTLEVTPTVLIPRPETELLVDWTGALVRDGRGRTDVVDLGTGSGAIALGIKHDHPHLHVVATDASDDALAVARRNAERLSLDVEFVHASWWNGLEDRRFDLVVANPPYVRAGDPALEALRHEPSSALTPGGDGLGALSAIVAGAKEHLRRGGWLLLEHGFDQAEAVRSLLRSAGFIDIETRHDLALHPRATGATLPPPDA